MPGSLFIAWTIRAALLCYVACLAGWLTLNSRRWPVARWIWTIGCGLFLAHVGCAFHFVHHWSHAAAWQDTAEQTQKLIGVSFGDGIYFSYLFLVTWVLDVVWLWFVPQIASVADDSQTDAAAHCATVVPPGRDCGMTPLWRLLVHGFLFFIAFNGAVVFKAGVTRWAGIVLTGALAALFGRWVYNFRVPADQGFVKSFTRTTSIPVASGQEPVAR